MVWGGWDNGVVLRGNVLGGGTVVVAGSETELRGCKVVRDVKTTSICYYFILSTEFHRFE